MIELKGEKTLKNRWRKCWFLSPKW